MSIPHGDGTSVSEPQAPDRVAWLSDEEPDKAAFLVVIDLGAAIVGMRMLSRLNTVINGDVADHHIAALERAMLVDLDPNTQGAEK